MKKTVVMTLAVLLSSFIITLSAGAVDAPHYDPTAGIICSSCHTVQQTLGSTGYNNICQNCHRPGDSLAGNKPITPADAANPFGNHSSNGVSKMYQTSHRWDGSDTVPSAGAQPPVQAQMTTNNLRGRTSQSLACVRCHNQHSNANGSFLRIANDSDQMCLDCHRSRNSTDHTKGSHPVGVNYAQKRAANPTGFNAVPVNSNPANTSSAMKLLGGTTVSCSTCHGVHFTDSRSSTADGSANFANLSSGDGNLLRTDARGAAVGAGLADNTSLCTNCHAGKRSHNMKGQDIQCANCHGAHVEFDPNDPTGAKGVNVYLVKRAVVKGASGNGEVFFRYTGSRREYKNAQGSGVCQGCHAVPAPGGIYPGEHASSDPKVCNTCHYHNSNNGSFSGACSACHGYPPLSATVGGPDGLAVPATGATPATPGAHETHAKRRFMACNTCHTGYAAKTMPSNSIDIGFSINGANFPGFGGAVSGGTFNGTVLNGGYSWSVAPGTNLTTGNSVVTCTVYCHGSTLSGGSATPPTWTTTDGSQNACGACHGVTAATAPSTGSHQLHAGNGAGGLSLSCETCHGTHVNNVHVNGSVEWDVSGLAGGATYKGTVSGGTGAVAPSASFGTCTNFCHGQGAPTWGATSGSPVNGFPYSAAQCGKCHSESGAVTAGTPFYSTAIPKVTLNTNAKVGAHTAHLTSSENLHPALICAECHGTVALSDATHMNGSTTFNFGTLAKTGGLTPTYSGGTCSNIYCHGGAMPGGDTSGTNRTPSWNDPNYLSVSLSVAGCGTCHGFPPPTSAGHPAVTLPAGFPSASVTIGPTCNCHSNVNPAGYSYATIFLDNTKHINGTLEGGTCNACHGYPPVSAGFVGAGTVGNWENAGTEDYLGGGGAHTINGHVSKLAKHNDGFAFCSKCHSAVDHATSAGFKPSSSIKVNVDQRYKMESTKQARYTSNRLDGGSHVAGNCSNISCHFGASPPWN